MHLAKISGLSALLIAMTLCVAGEALGQSTARSFRPFNPFAVKPTVQADFGKNPFAVLRPTSNPFAGDGLFAVGELPAATTTGGPAADESPLNGDSSVLTGSGVIFAPPAESGGGTRPYRPPVRSPYRPAPRPPF
jgi:hypothetical protein